VLRRLFSKLSPKFVTYVATEGIGNRLRIHYLAAAYATRHEIPLIMNWPVNHACGATFLDLFRPVGLPRIETPSPAILRFYKKLLTSFGQRLNIDAISTNHTVNVIGLKQVVPTEFGEAIRCHAFANNGNVLGEYKDIVRNSLAPSDEVRCRVDLIRGKLPGTFVGVHIRRCDFLAVFPDQCRSDDDYFRECDCLLEQHPDTVFFIACDDAAVLAKFSERYPIVTQPRPNYSENWINDGNGLFFNYGERSSREGAISAAVDLWMLSRSRLIIGTPMSSFSQAAAFIGDIPLIFPSLTSR
jgi:hypothetical protein